MGRRERVRQKTQKHKQIKKLAKKLKPGGALAASAAAAAVSRGKCLRFTPNERILVLGDGDLSFSAGLAEHVNNAEQVTATTFDAAKTTEEKYGAAFLHNAQRVRERGGSVLHGVDARRLQRTLRAAVARHQLPTKHAGPFDAVVFNFPHTGKQRSHLNKSLVANLVEDVPNVLATNGRVCVTIKLAPPYDRWDVPSMETDAMAFVRRLDFDSSVFPGYRHVTTEKGAKPLMKNAQKANNVAAPSTAATLALRKEESKCKTFVFQLRTSGAAAASAGGEEEMERREEQEEEQDPEKTRQRQDTQAALAALGWTL